MELTGSVFDIGVDGKTTLTGPGAVTFTLHQAGLADSNPETGPIVKFLYSQYVHKHRHDCRVISPVLCYFL